jgi:hypothetical protein
MTELCGETLGARAHRIWLRWASADGLEGNHADLSVEEAYVFLGSWSLHKAAEVPNRHSPVALVALVARNRAELGSVLGEVRQDDVEEEDREHTAIKQDHTHFHFARNNMDPQRCLFGYELEKLQPETLATSCNLFHSISKSRQEMSDVS